MPVKIRCYCHAYGCWDCEHSAYSGNVHYPSCTKVKKKYITNLERPNDCEFLSKRAEKLPINYHVDTPKTQLEMFNETAG